MKIIIAGSRTIKDYDLLKQVIEDSKLEITEVVSGAAPGVDSLGERWAKEHGVPIKQFPAKWNDWEGLPEKKVKLKYGRYGQYNVLAGFNRNEDMADYAEGLIALTTGSPGTANMISLSEERCLAVYVWRI